MLARSVHDPVVADALPETLALLEEWDGETLPGEPVFAAAARELTSALEGRMAGRLGGRVNRVASGMRSVIVRGARAAAETPAASARDTLIGGHPAWGEPATWRAVRTAGERFTLRHYLRALDLGRGPDGGIVRQPEELRIYVPLLLRTLLVSGAVTLLCLLLGYPIAHLIASSPPSRARWLLLLVLVPFWTSLLVRTTAWIVLLQTHGVLNSLLVALGVISDDGRIAMIYNMTGTLVAMTHVLLPFMVLPLYSVMRTIPPHFLRAAASLGANRRQAFFRVYWPLTLPGTAAGALLVFILAIGYYITPALVGGASGQLFSNMIAFHMQTSLNWGLAAALGGILFVVVGDRSTWCTTGWWAPPACGLGRRGSQNAGRRGLTGRLPGVLRLGLRLPGRPDPGDHSAQLQRRALLHLHRGDAPAGPRRLVASLVRRPRGRPPAGAGRSPTAWGSGSPPPCWRPCSAPWRRSGSRARRCPLRRLVTGILISPMVIPVIIAAAGMFFFYSDLRLTQSHLGLILAHAALGTPFVVITVTATLSGFDRNLVRASQSLGAGPLTTFRRVQLPLIAPGVLSGALFAFAASFDEVVIVLFMGGVNQRTIPRQMWSGIREEISPTILAAATFLIAFALLFLFAVERLRSRTR